MRQSGQLGAGGGAFARDDFPADAVIGQYTGDVVRASVVHGRGYAVGYVMRVGSSYVDARDHPAGMLVLSNRKVVDVSDWTHAAWGRLKHVGVTWKGSANLTRFVNRVNVGGTSNCLFHSDGSLYVGKRGVRKNEELLASRQGYGAFPPRAP